MKVKQFTQKMRFEKEFYDWIKPSFCIKHILQTESLGFSGHEFTVTIFYEEV